MRALRLLVIVLSAALFSCVAVQAQERSYRQFLSKDGLPGDNVYSIVQDKTGLIWIATETGLSRYDGTSFKNFTVKNGLPGNEIISLFVDHANRIWISAFQCGPCYYLNGKIFNRSNSKLLSKFPADATLRAMAEDGAGNLLFEWLTGYIMIDAFDRCVQLPVPFDRRGFFKPLRGFHSLPKEIISPDIIAASNASSDQYDYNFYNNKPFANCVFAEAGGCMLVYHPDGSIVRIRIPPNTHSQYPINDSILVCATTNGGYVFDVRTGEVLQHFLPGYWVNHVYIDDEGGAWVGTFGSGIFYFPAGSGLSVRQTPAGKPLQLLNFYPTGRSLIAGTSNSTFWKIDRNTSGLGAHLDKKQLNSSMLEIAAGNMIRPIASELLTLPALQHLAPNLSAPKSMVRAGDSFIIAASNAVIKVGAGSTDGRRLWNARATSAILWNGRYYVGTLSGLYSFQDGLADACLPSDSLRLAGGNIGSMAFTTLPRMLWVATSDNGVYCIDSNNKLLHVFNEAAGLSGNICKCIFSDGHRVFVGTNNGLNVIEPARNFAFESYYTLDGLASNDISCVYAEGNRLWVGTPEGYSYLDLNALTFNKSYCRFSITDVIVSGKALPLVASHLTLSPEDNNIEFHFSGISFRSMGRMKYTYRLAGLERDSQQTTVNYLSYPSLPAGDYRLEIFATNRYGVKSMPSVLSFTILQHWWRLIWVQAAGIVLILAIVVWALWVRHSRMRLREREKAALKAQIADLEQLALRAQMNPHFIFNSLNSFYQYVIHKDLPGASKFMGDFSTLLRLMFEITAQKEITLEKELLFLRTYLELERTKLRERFDYAIEVSEDLRHAEEILIPTFTIQPFVENSIRHGIAALQNRKGHISISFDKVDDELVVRLKDNGIGRSLSATQKEGRLAIHQSKGMALTGERIFLYNKSNATNVRFEVSDVVPEGTQVIIYFPLDIT